jgi:hypothetical protein
MQIIGTGRQRAAKTSRIQVGTSTNSYLTFASWEVALKGDDYDTTNFESYNAAGFGGGQSFGEGVLGPVECDITFGGDWDAGANAPGYPSPFVNPPGLYPRDDLAAVNFYTSRLDNTLFAVAPWNFPYMRVRGATNGGEIRGKVTFKVTGKSQGPFTFPATNAGP